MIDGSEKRNRQLAFELQNSHICEKRSKDAVSIPGVSLQYLLRRMLQRFYDPELYAPGKKVYEMPKGAVVGGTSLVSLESMRREKRR